MALLFEHNYPSLSQLAGAHLEFIQFDTTGHYIYGIGWTNEILKVHLVTGEVQSFDISDIYFHKFCDLHVRHQLRNGTVLKHGCPGISLTHRPPMQFRCLYPSYQFDGRILLVGACFARSELEPSEMRSEMLVSGYSVQLDQKSSKVIDITKVIPQHPLCRYFKTCADMTRLYVASKEDNTMLKIFKYDLKKLHSNLPGKDEPSTFSVSVDSKIVESIGRRQSSMTVLGNMLYLLSPFDCFSLFTIDLHTLETSFHSLTYLLPDPVHGLPMGAFCAETSVACSFDKAFMLGKSDDEYGTKRETFNEIWTLNLQLLEWKCRKLPPFPFLVPYKICAQNSGKAAVLVDPSHHSQWMTKLITLTADFPRLKTFAQNAVMRCIKNVLEFDDEECVEKVGIPKTILLRTD